MDFNSRVVAVFVLRLRIIPGASTYNEENIRKIEKNEKLLKLYYFFHQLCIHCDIIT